MCDEFEIAEVCDEEHNLSGVQPFYSAETSLNTSASSYHTCDNCSKEKNVLCTCSCPKQSSRLMTSMLTPSPLSSVKYVISNFVI